MNKTESYYIKLVLQYMLFSKSLSSSFITTYSIRCNYNMIIIIICSPPLFLPQLTFLYQYSSFHLLSTNCIVVKFPSISPVPQTIMHYPPISQTITYSSLNIIYYFQYLVRPTCCDFYLSTCCNTFLNLLLLLLKLVAPHFSTCCFSFFHLLITLIPLVASLFSSFSFQYSIYR